MTSNRGCVCGEINTRHCPVHGQDSKPTISPLSFDQWALLCRLNPKFFDAFADLTADITALMEEDRPNRLFFPGYTWGLDKQTLTLSFHMAMVG